MTDDVEDLLGEEPETPARKPRRKEHVASGGYQNPGASVVQAMLKPVSITFISEVLLMDRKTVTRRLKDLPHVSMHRGNSPLYDFRQALPYLVTPKIDMDALVKRLNADDLPASLQKDVWDARLKALQWRERAGELWKTDDVLEVLGEAFQRLKTTTQLWIDQIGDNHALPAAARKELTDLVDGLQTDLHQTLVEMPRDKSTLSATGEQEDGDD